MLMMEAQPPRPNQSKETTPWPDGKSEHLTVPSLNSLVGSEKSAKSPWTPPLEEPELELESELESELGPELELELELGLEAAALDRVVVAATEVVCWPWAALVATAAVGCWAWVVLAAPIMLPFASTTWVTVTTSRRWWLWCS